MQIRQTSTIAVVCVFSCWCTALDAAGVYTLSRGRQLMLAHGLQIQGAVEYPASGRPATDGFSDVNRWLSARFTTINFDNVWAHAAAAPSVLAQMPTGTQWSRWYPMGVSGYEEYKNLLPSELPYKDNLVSFQCGDEMSTVGDPATQSEMAETYAEWRRLYPNALVYTNLAGLQAPYTVADLQKYMAATKPDMIMHDSYPTNAKFYAAVSDGGFYCRTDWYAAMQRYRVAGLAGIDGTGKSPIPYGQWLNLFRSRSTDPLPSESFIRLQQNASWAFGYTFVSGYVYNGCPNYLTAAMFNGPGDGAPTPVFNYVAETNRQSRNLGPALTRLVSTDLQMIKGSAFASLPDGISPWNESGHGGSHWHNSHTAKTGVYTDYLTSIAPITGPGGPASTSYSDILIGYFNPLLSDNNDCTFADGLHFMIVNGAIGNGIPVSADGVADAAAAQANSAAALAQWYHLTFDFTGSDYDSLVRLSRETGRVELVALTPIGRSNYCVDLNLLGGTGDLFAFWKSGDPLPTVSEPSTAAMMTTGAIGLAASIGASQLAVRRTLRESKERD